ncbi:transcriptional regulator, TetR family [Nocardioidaceae bacterium Broad-1]|nr:transcriptional regulator, TetR family [Nocardioidaceae bacterium Broad-1]
MLAPMKRRHGDSARQRRDALVRATIEVAAEKGMAGVTHRAVTERAGLPLATVGYFFDSISDLAAEALRTGVAEDVARLRTLADELAATSPGTDAHGRGSRGGADVAADRRARVPGGTPPRRPRPRIPPRSWPRCSPPAATSPPARRPSPARPGPTRPPCSPSCTAICCTRSRPPTWSTPTTSCAGCAPL